MKNITRGFRLVVSGVSAVTLVLSVAGGIPTLAAAAVEPATNPTLAGSCGIDMVLVMDTSTSIDSTELGQMKTAFDSFANTMLPAADTAFISFDDSAILQQTFTTNASTLTTAIDGTSGSGFTNWESAINLAHSQFPADGKPHLIVFTSDGNPTASSAGPTDLSQPNIHLDPAITAANAAKADGIRIITLGIGNDLDVANLQAISSVDATFTTDFGTLGSDLHDLATSLCGNTITVVKVIDRDGNVDTTNDQTDIPAGAGWHFTVDGTDYVTTDTGTVTVDPIADQTTHAVTEASVNSGYQFVGASCDGSSTNNGSVDGQTVSGIEVGQHDIVTCTFYNKPLFGAVLVKKHVIDDNAGTASAADFSLQATGVNADPATSFNGDEAGTLVKLDPGSYSIAETGGPSGYTPSQTDTCSGSIAAGDYKICTVTNDDNTPPPPEQGTIIVVKHTVNADGSFAFTTDYTPASFSLSNNGSNSTNLGPGIYTVSEDGPLPNGWASDNGVCDSSDSEDSSTPGAIDLSAGETVTCTFTNTFSPSETSSVSVVKTVDDNTPDVGQTITYTITATDTGADATNVVVHDALPSGLTFVSTSTADMVGVYDSSTHDWTIGTLSSATPAELHIVATVNSGTGGDEISNTASISSESSGSDSDSVSLTVNTPFVQTFPPPTGSSGGGGGGPPVGLLGGGGNGPVQPQGQVLGASCGLYLTDYLRIIKLKNDPEQVKKLQTFLNEQLHINLPVTGFFGPLTEAAVRKFQASQDQGVLKPWVDAGLLKPGETTGYVYKTTKRWINLIKCPSLNIPLPALP